MTDLCGNSWDWRIGPKGSIAHRKAKEVRCQKIWKLRYVLSKASATVTGKVWKQRGKFQLGRKQMTRHDQCGAGQIQLDFIRIASFYEWQQEAVCRHNWIREGSKTHMTFNLPDRKWDLHICCGTQEHRVLTSSKKRTSAWSDHLLLSSNHRESWIPLDLPGCSGSAFIAELPTLELMPRSILGVSKSI